METKASIVIMSHLSDVQERQDLQVNNHKINFVKFLILRYPNTMDKIDPDKEYADFCRKHPNL